MVNARYTAFKINFISTGIGNKAQNMILVSRLHLYMPSHLIDDIIITLQL